MRNSIAFLIAIICFFLWQCSSETQPKENKGKPREENRIQRIEFRSRDYLDRLRYPLHQFSDMWEKSAKYQVVITATDTLQMIDSLLTHLSGGIPEKKTDIRAGMLVMRNHTTDTVVFGGGVFYRDSLYALESNVLLINILSRYLPLVDQLVWRAAASPDDTLLQQQLHKAINQTMQLE